ncbi:hypothetical protein ACRBEV_18555 [Methylobacterium phyllosphaerae]
MAGSLDNELKRTREELAGIASELTVAIQKIQVDAAEGVMRLVGEADVRKAALLVRLSHLQALVGTSPLPSLEEAAPAPRGRAYQPRTQS